MIQFIRFIFSKVFWINAGIAILIICAGLYFTLRYLGDYTLHGQEIVVPDLTGKYFADLDTLLDSTAFIPVISDSIYLREMKPGEIVDQVPKGGKTVKQGRKIYLSIAAQSPPQISMPNLIDLSLRQATSLLETYGLKVGKLTYKPDLCTNCILGQKFRGKAISEGVKIERGLEIDLIVGQGLSNELTAVPYLIGSTAETAEIILQAAFLNVGGLIYDNTSVLTAEDSANARIYKQNPFYSEEPIVPMGSSIDLYLSLDTNRIIHSVNPADSI